MTSAVVLSDCGGCDAAAEYLRRLRTQHGATRVTVRCDECGAQLTSRREPKAPAPLRVPTADELAQRAARDLDAWLRDAAAIARWRAHESRDRASVLASLQGTVASAGTAAEADASRGPRVEGDRERDLRRGRALDAVLRGLEAAVARRTAERRALELVRVLASLAAYVEGRPMPDALPDDWEAAPGRAVAVLVFCCERLGAARVRFKSPAEVVGAAFMATRALRGHTTKGDLALATTAHGAPLLAAAVALWTRARAEQKGFGESLKS